jgi:indolepyruvate ferredoxin oxidoreductase alpha subunit
MSEHQKEALMSGNEAIARGAVEAGVGFCASYPGTPSTEITEELMREATKTGELCVEWSINEKVALEAAAAASWAGVPALCPMKSLGLNVASDFLLNVNLTGTGPGGLVIVVCDDPLGHSSSNEQDSRFYAKAAQVPLLEPSSYQDAKDIIVFAFQISKQFQVPVIVRSTTRLSHSRGLVRLGKIPKKHQQAERIPKGLFNVPSPAKKHAELISKLQKITALYDESKWNRIAADEDADTLIISSGVSTRYVEEAITNLQPVKASALGLVTVYPLPEKTIADALARYKNVAFFEENSPFIEDEVRAFATAVGSNASLLGIRTGDGQEGGETSTDRALEFLSRDDILGPHQGDFSKPPAKSSLLSKRDLTFCAGCTHRNFYYAVKLLRKRMRGNLCVAGDIGCYSLGVFYDEAMNTMHAMGSGIGVASGLGQLQRFGFNQKVLAVAGDSTFFHACIPALVDCRQKNADVTFVILDNGTTAMTGFQTHPGSKTQSGNHTRVDIRKMTEAVEPDHFERASAEDPEELVNILHAMVKKKGLKVLLLDSVCRLEEQRRPTAQTKAEVRVIPDMCKGESCQICVREFGCPAITWDYAEGRPKILLNQCVMCGACISVCPHGAIRGEEE